MSLLLKLLTVFLLLFPSLATADPRTVRILHVNDFHGFAHPVNAPGMTRPLGGGTLLADRIGRHRADRPALLLAAGDMIQGDSWANLSSGASVIELMNVIGFDAMVTGNHEFDFGCETLKKRVSEASFPVLAANVAGLDSLRPYTIVERGGLRIGIIGLVTEDVPETSHPRNTAGLRFTSVADRAVELLREVRPRTDLVILLTHIGHAADRELAEKLARQPDTPAGGTVRGGLLIIGGHSHTRVEKPVRIGDVWVAQAWEYGKTLGVIDVTVDRGRITACNGTLEEVAGGPDDGDRRVASLVRKYDDRIEALLDRRVGSTAVDLVQDGIRLRETNLGDLVADIVREQAGADAAVINGGSIRTGIRRGPVTMRDIYATLPFNNYIVAVRMNGRMLREALEHGVSGLENGEGRFPQVSGLSFVFDPALPPGSRIAGVKIGGSPLEDGRDYVIATLDFMAAGGDGYRSFGAAIRSSGDFSEIGGALHSSRLVYNEPGRWLRDEVAGYLQRHGEIAPVTGDRIRERVR